MAGRRVRLRQLDSTDPDHPLWSPEAISANADRAVEDPSAIAYLGELGYGATAVSLPITNDAGLLQVSPTDGLTSLTRSPPGRERAGPERYYPTGTRSFVRLVPDDLLQTETLLERIRATGAQRLAVVFDTDIYGRELGAELVARARRDGPEPVVAEEYDGDPEDVPDLVRELAEAHPDAIVYAGVAGARARARCMAGIDEGLPDVPMYATSGMLDRDPRPPDPGRAAARSRRSRRSSRRRACRARGGASCAGSRRPTGRAAARPEALYGYEAMRLALDAIRRGGPDRRRVVDAALRIRMRDSVIGRYGIRGDRGCGWRCIRGL